MVVVVKLAYLSLELLNFQLLFLMIFQEALAACVAFVIIWTISATEYLINGVQAAALPCRSINTEHWTPQEQCTFRWTSVNERVKFPALYGYDDDETGSWVITYPPSLISLIVAVKGITSNSRESLPEEGPFVLPSSQWS